MATTVLPGGRPIAVTGSRDATVRIWDLATGELAGLRVPHLGELHAVAALRNDQEVYLVTAGAGIACLVLTPDRSPRA